MTARLRLLAGIALLAGCTTPAPPPEAPAEEAPREEQAQTDLGTVRFPVSCDPAVQEEFDRAVTRLHHMMYEQAREAFVEVAQTDADCAMAHWGVAMTLFQPLWPTRPSPEDLQRGIEALETARRIGGTTAREEAFLDAAEAFYREPDTADWSTRLQRFEAAMEEVHRSHPEDPEAATLYALSHLAVGAGAEDRASYHDRAAAILLDVHREHPTHPGAIHYLIHANDTDRRAGHSLEVVRRYGEIAPDVPHALHMPSHIFVRLGEWEDVIEWNRRSADAALRHSVDGRISHHYLHGLDYMLYGHLQRGEDAEAEAVLQEALERAADPGYQQSFISAFHLASMPARYAVEREDWERASQLEPRSPADLDWESYPMPEALTWYARGLAAVRTGDLEATHANIQRMAALADRAEAMGEPGWKQLVEADRLVLAGLLAHAEGDATAAVERLQEAAAIEARTEKPPVTPGALLPPLEALGDLLLELDRPDEALTAYQQSLERWPRRFRSLRGAARAAHLAGEPEVAAAMYAELLEVTADDADRQQVVEESRRYLEGRGTGGI